MTVDAVFGRYWCQVRAHPMTIACKRVWAHCWLSVFSVAACDGCSVHFFFLYCHHHRYHHRIGTFGATLVNCNTTAATATSASASKTEPLDCCKSAAVPLPTVRETAKGERETPRKALRATTIQTNNHPPSMGVCVCAWVKRRKQRMLQYGQ